LEFARRDQRLPLHKQPTRGQLHGRDGTAAHSTTGSAVRMGRRADHDTLLRELATPTAAFQPLYVVSGDEPLLLVEAADAVRARARQDGFTERSSFTLDARADWSQLFAVAQNIS